MLVSVPAEFFDVAGSVVALLFIGLEPIVEGALTPLLGAGAGGLFLTSAPNPLADPDKLNNRYGHCRKPTSDNIHSNDN